MFIRVVELARHKLSINTQASFLDVDWGDGQRREHAGFVLTRAFAANHWVTVIIGAQPRACDHYQPFCAPLPLSS